MISSLTYQQSVSAHYHSDRHFSEFYLQDGGKNQLVQIWNKITSLLLYAYSQHIRFYFLVLLFFNTFSCRFRAID